MRVDVDVDVDAVNITDFSGGGDTVAMWPMDLTRIIILFFAGVVTITCIAILCYAAANADDNRDHRDHRDQQPGSRHRRRLRVHATPHHHQHRCRCGYHEPSIATFQDPEDPSSFETMPITVSIARTGSNSFRLVIEPKTTHDVVTDGAQ